MAIYNIYTTEEALKVLVNAPRLTFNDLKKDLHKDSSFIEILGKYSLKEVPGVIKRQEINM